MAKKSKQFERLVSLIFNDEFGDDLTVIPNARIRGQISQRSRQIDLLVEKRFGGDVSSRLIIDAKSQRKPIDIKQVEEFEGFMRDVRAKRGILVCMHGFTKAASRRAEEHIGIRLVNESEIAGLNILDWDHCLHPKCSNSGMVLWDASPGIFVNEMLTVQMIGKCDECGRFHVWCWGCGNRNAMDDVEEWQCTCKSRWFWLTSIEPPDEEYPNGVKCLILVLISSNNEIKFENYDVVDVRPL